MRKITFILSLFLLASCSRKSTPQIQFVDNIITHYDTSFITTDGVVDTIYSRVPCDSFVPYVNGKDTVYIKEYKTKIVTQKIRQTDTVYRQIIINNPQPRKLKIDNSVTAKDQSVVGDGKAGDRTKKGSSWWWIFLAGYLCNTIVRRVFVPLLRRYIPFGNIISSIGSKIRFNG